MIFIDELVTDIEFEIFNRFIIDARPDGELFQVRGIILGTEASFEGGMKSFYNVFFDPEAEVDPEVIGVSGDWGCGEHEAAESGGGFNRA